MKEGGYEGNPYTLPCVKQMADGSCIKGQDPQLGALWWDLEGRMGWEGGRLKREGVYVYIF